MFVLNFGILFKQRIEGIAFMRQIVLDTETTGLRVEEGHKIIEVAGVELINKQFTGRYCQHYIQPHRSVDPDSVRIHGITDEFLRDKPSFSQIASSLLDFLKGAELIIHNAPFDIGFLNHEFQLVSADYLPITEYCAVLDTLSLARKKHPGQANNLDALCKRYHIDRSKRQLHGALVDVHLLARVYLAMTEGSQLCLFEMAETSPPPPPSSVSAPLTEDSDKDPSSSLSASRKPLKIIYADQEALMAHAQWISVLEQVSGAAAWK